MTTVRPAAVVGANEHREIIVGTEQSGDVVHRVVAIVTQNQPLAFGVSPTAAPATETVEFSLEGTGEELLHRRLFEQPFLATSQTQGFGQEFRVTGGRAVQTARWPHDR